MATSPATPNERMAVRAARELRNHEVVFVGIGLPNLACNLARRTHAPDLFMIYESGAVGTVPKRLPISIGDPALVTDSLAIVSQADIFYQFLHRGLVEVGFLGGAQIDPFGNINSTVIGSYADPKIRLPGSGGACEIATHAKRLLVVMKMSPKSFVEKVDFITSPGHQMRGRPRSEIPGLPGKGPEVVITQFGVFRFESGRMVLTELFRDVSVDDVKKASGFEIQTARQLETTADPDEGDLRLIREELDPSGLFL